MSTEKAMLEMAKAGLKQATGITDEDFEKYVQQYHNLKMLSRPEIFKYKLVAEVIESKYCGAGLRPGHKLVMRALPAVIVLEESDCPLCVRAIGPIASLVNGFWDRIIEGIDPNAGLWNIAHCADPGIDGGGLGHVKFKVYAQRSE